MNEESLNNLIAELKESLLPVQERKRKEFKETKRPVIFVIGNPRSGTTLILQWLASLGVFSYPSNVLNRFAYAPYIGALIQNMLFDKDYDPNGDFKDIQSNINFDSDLGKSKGALATNEFQHFIRNYMHDSSIKYPTALTKKEIKEFNFNDFCRDLASIELALNRPFVTKGAMLQFNIIELYNAFKKSIFVFTKRDPFLNMQSIFLARKKYYNDYNTWWSVKPKEYEFLKDMDIYHQIAGQVYFTNKKIEEDLENIPEENQLTFEYEKFCENPKYYFEEIKKKYAFWGYNISSEYAGPPSFTASNKLRISKKDENKFREAYQYFSNKEYEK